MTEWSPTNSNGEMKRCCRNCYYLKRNKLSIRAVPCNRCFDEPGLPRFIPEVAGAVVAPPHAYKGRVV